MNLTFWDELAHAAFQHVEKGHQVFVSGRLVSDVVAEEDDEKRQVYYKVSSFFFLSCRIRVPALVVFVAVFMV